MKKLSFLFTVLLVLLFSMIVVSCPGGKATETVSLELDDEYYEFTHYFNYDWWGLKEWGKDMVSTYFKELYNIQVNFEKPDSDPRAKLNIMISSNDLPDSMMMDRNEDLVELGKLGLLQDLEQFFPLNTNFQDNVLEVTREQLKIDGVLYGIPNWPRKAPTGGNDVWFYNTFIYEDAGSPPLMTLNDVHDYMLKAQELGETREGFPIVPLMFADGSNGQRIANAFFRSYGGILVEGWFTVRNNNLIFALRDDVFIESTLKANEWWREGLINPTQFTDTKDQVLEKLSTGRPAISYYDHSGTAADKWRISLIESQNGNSYEIADVPYPPAEGYTTDDIIADIKPTTGWNVTVISKQAQKPARIYELWTSFLKRENSIIQMYGPPGELWDELDADGLPVLKKNESELSEDEINRLGLWFWMIPGQSDNVDNVKFAVNARLPVEKQDWVIATQTNILTPIMFTTDEFNNINQSIDSQAEEGINRRLCIDYIESNYPRAISADSAEECRQILDEILEFCLSNGFDEVERIYAEKHRDNADKYGGVVKR